MAQFEVGKEYKTRSIGDYDCILPFRSPGAQRKPFLITTWAGPAAPWSTLTRMANGSSRTGTAWPPRSGPAAQFERGVRNE